jgi:hypothetical protein
VGVVSEPSNEAAIDLTDFLACSSAEATDARLTGSVLFGCASVADGLESELTSPLAGFARSVSLGCSISVGDSGLESTLESAASSNFYQTLA